MRVFVESVGILPYCSTNPVEIGKPHHLITCVHGVAKNKRYFDFCAEYGRVSAMRIVYKVCVVILVQTLDLLISLHVVFSELLQHYILQSVQTTLLFAVSALRSVCVRIAVEECVNGVTLPARNLPHTARTGRRCSHGFSKEEYPGRDLRVCKDLPSTIKKARTFSLFVLCASVTFWLPFPATPLEGRRFGLWFRLSGGGGCGCKKRHRS